MQHFQEYQHCLPLQQENGTVEGIGIPPLEAHHFHQSQKHQGHISKDSGTAYMGLLVHCSAAR